MQMLLVFLMSFLSAEMELSYGVDILHLTLQNPLRLVVSGHKL